MILQEIIRNIALYNGFILPWIQSVKENLFIDKNNAVYLEANSSNKVSLFPLISITGTHTITGRNINLLHYLEGKEICITKDSASNSNDFISMLVTEKIVGLGKSNFFTHSPSVRFSSDYITAAQITTTGFSIENIQLFFSHETHEKREYLGEFSLPHEENHFNSFIERR